MSFSHIELAPHVALQQTAAGPVEVRFHQRWIQAVNDDGNKIAMGLVGTQPGAPVNFFRQPGGQPWPDCIKQAALDKIAEELGDGARKACQQPDWREDDKENDLQDDADE